MVINKYYHYNKYYNYWVLPLAKINPPSLRLDSSKAQRAKRCISSPDKLQSCGRLAVLATGPGALARGRHAEKHGKTYEDMGKYGKTWEDMGKNMVNGG